MPVSDSQRKKDDGESSRKIEAGRALLDNNGVNFVMAVTMGFGGMAVASLLWGVPLRTILP